MFVDKQSYPLANARCVRARPASDVIDPRPRMDIGQSSSREMGWPTRVVQNAIQLLCRFNSKSGFYEVGRDNQMRRMAERNLHRAIEATRTKMQTTFHVLGVVKIVHNGDINIKVYISQEIVSIKKMLRQLPTSICASLNTQQPLQPATAMRRKFNVRVANDETPSPHVFKYSPMARVQPQCVNPTYSTPKSSKSTKTVLDMINGGSDINQRTAVCCEKSTKLKKYINLQDCLLRPSPLLPPSSPGLSADIIFSRRSSFRKRIYAVPK